MRERGKHARRHVPCMATRCLTACLALAIGVAALGTAILAGRAHDEGGAVAAAAAGVGTGVSPRDLARSILAGDAAEAMEALGAGETDAAAALPADFEEELFSLAGYDRVMMDNAGLVGFGYRGSAEELFGTLRRELEDKGWVCTPLGVGSSGTFTKESGVYRWVFLSCYPAGAEVSAVLQYR